MPAKKGLTKGQLNNQVDNKLPKNTRIYWDIVRRSPGYKFVYKSFSKMCFFDKASKEDFGRTIAKSFRLNRLIDPNEPYPNGLSIIPAFQIELVESNLDNLELDLKKAATKFVKSLAKFQNSTGSLAIIIADVGHPLFRLKEVTSALKLVLPKRQSKSRLFWEHMDLKLRIHDLHLSGLNYYKIAKIFSQEEKDRGLRPSFTFQKVKSNHIQFLKILADPFWRR